MKTFLVALILAVSATSGLADDHPKFSATVLVGATSDYVYRGVSLRDQKPSPIAYAEASYGIAYVNGVLIGTDLGDDALGRGIGNFEADVTAGILPVIGGVTFNLGAKYTGYPSGRDLIAGTIDKAERDFIEPFAGVTVPVLDALSLGGTVFWTPDFYNETGRVRTGEFAGTLKLPDWYATSSKLTTALGIVESERMNVVAPGHRYRYFNVGLETRFERLIFDLRYWATDVDSIAVFDDRVALTIGVALN